MFFDIAIGIILITTMVFGFRRGFVFTIVHTLGWFGAMLIAFCAASPVRTLFVTRTMLDENLHDMFFEKLMASSDALTTAASSLPPVYRTEFNAMASDAADFLANQLTFIATMLFPFLFVLLIVKLLLFFLTITLSKQHNKGFRNIFDGILGLVAGLLRGIIFVFLFLTVLIPLVNLISPTATSFFVNSLDASFFAKTLYDNNFIVVLMHDFLA